MGKGVREKCVMGRERRATQRCQQSKIPAIGLDAWLKCQIERWGSRTLSGGDLALEKPRGGLAMGKGCSRGGGQRAVAGSVGTAAAAKGVVEDQGMK